MPSSSSSQFVSPYTDEALERMKTIWEDVPELSAVHLGAMFGVTKNAVIGQAARRKWRARRGVWVEPITTMQRLDALDVFPQAGCVYPIGHPGHAEFHFCGEPVKPGDEDRSYSYCHAHHKRTHISENAARRVAEWAADPARHLQQEATGRRNFVLYQMGERRQRGLAKANR